MQQEFSKQGVMSGYTAVLLTAMWVLSAVVEVAQSGLVA